MKQFRDILVYAEIDDEACLNQVVTLAAAHGAAITVCEVVEPVPSGQDMRGVVERLGKLRRARARQRLKRIVDGFAAHPMIDYSVFTGVPFMAIIEQVVQQDFDLVVHISEPVRMDDGAGLNATGMHLMRKCPCAVWALHPERGEHGPSITLALDRERSAQATAAEAFAIGLAETALGLAAARGGDLHVIHAWQPYGFELLADPELELDASDRAAYLRQQQGDNEQWFRRIVQRIESLAPDGLRVRAELVRGDAVSVVPQRVEAERSGMLVLGTTGTSANPGVLIGPTTESILAICGVPVLALKPPGFVSPLMLATARDIQA
ncbi:MAG: universal stress protein [Halieaceae bacterium]|nr:universal stress protein [Halieaceae bacterium]